MLMPDSIARESGTYERSLGPSESLVINKPTRKRRILLTSTDQEAVYVCDSCGEEIIVPVDVSAGAHQDYTEDCPVCCHPMSLHVDIDPDGEAHVEGEHE
jgi:hypothetical protein